MRNEREGASIAYQKMKKERGSRIVKSLSRALLALYLLLLLWLVLFKLSFDLLSVILTHQTRSINLIPFAGSVNLGEIIDNCVVFIPLGLLLSVNFKRANFWRKLAFVSVLSLAVETAQFVLAIGVTDITDLIANTFGGFLGLILYDLSNKYISGEILDRFIVLVGTILLVSLIMLRVLVFKVRY
jgi:glycopeptide antibiotics resistance protein